MKKQFLSFAFIAVSVFGLASCGAGANSSSGYPTVFRTEATTGKLQYEVIAEQVVVYYINDSEMNVRYDVSNAARFNVGENTGIASKFKVIDDRVYYPNPEVNPDDKTETILVYRALKMDKAAGEKVIFIDETLFEEYKDALAEDNFDNLTVGDYADIGIDLDFTVPSGGLATE
ncbi:MAG: hypothetical protein LKF69_02340 [Bacilli bacterium]|jgi:hypothetical protein|nr:hypothetical protein [Bacilli bacterium]MCH4235625.1 hypothetical protein [Bacilli bacterium]